MEKDFPLEALDDHINQLSVDSMDEDLLNVIRSILKTQRYGVLVTQDTPFPHGALVAFSHDDSLKQLVFMTSSETRKFSHLKTDPRSTLFIDNRNNLKQDIYNSVSISLKGHCNVLEMEQHEAWKDRFLKKHDNLAQFIDSPATKMICMTVEKIEIVSRFQNVLIVGVDNG